VRPPYRSEGKSHRMRFPSEHSDGGPRCRLLDWQQSDTHGKCLAVGKFIFTEVCIHKRHRPCRFSVRPSIALVNQIEESEIASDSAPLSTALYQ
jgi:hypothetical protein